VVLLSEDVGRRPKHVEVCTVIRGESRFVGPDNYKIWGTHFKKKNTIYESKIIYEGEYFLEWEKKWQRNINL
jgi:hypothetical protein